MGLLGQYLPLAAHSKGTTGAGNTCGEVHQLSKFTSTLTPDSRAALEPPGWRGHQELLDSTAPHCPKAEPAASMMQNRSSPPCTSTSIPASEAAPDTVQGLQTPLPAPEQHTEGTTSHQTPHPKPLQGT